MTGATERALEHDLRADGEIGQCADAQVSRGDIDDSCVCREQSGQAIRDHQRRGRSDQRRRGGESECGPARAFRTVDLSVFKTTKLTDGVSLQVRCEVFNVFNTINWANPGATLSSSTTFGLMTNTRNGSGAPGIGAGEPRNVQLAAKLIF